MQVSTGCPTMRRTPTCSSGLLSRLNSRRTSLYPNHSQASAAILARTRRAGNRLEGRGRTPSKTGRLVTR
eukprot:4549197-Pyramimonas_sp.AAC.1